MVRQVAGLVLEGFGVYDELVAKCRASVAPLCETAELRLVRGLELAVIEKRLAADRNELKSPGIALSRLEEIRTELDTLPLKLDRMVSVARFAKSYAALDCLTTEC